MSYIDKSSLTSTLPFLGPKEQNDLLFWCVGMRHRTEIISDESLSVHGYLNLKKEPFGFGASRAGDKSYYSTALSEFAENIPSNQEKYQETMSTIARECRFWTQNKRLQTIERNVFVRIPKMISEGDYRRASWYIFKYWGLFVAIILCFLTIVKKAKVIIRRSEKSKYKRQKKVF